MANIATVGTFIAIAKTRSYPVDPPRRQLKRGERAYRAGQLEHFRNCGGVGSEARLAFSQGKGRPSVTLRSTPIAKMF